MKVLKFGGTSVGSSENIKKIVEIISKNDSQTTQYIVVSAFATVTNLLIDAAQLASIKNSSYTTVLQKIKDIHLSIIKGLTHAKEQKKLNDQVENKFEELKQVLQSISLIHDLSAKSEANILSYGELLSSYIIAEILSQHGIDAVRKDSRELI
ncbi:MAG: bifunctional aspartate kinase/homoserine dehydrogenase I, partial [Bacteroidia bacterium]|nr:bifunctional aspartate kinase/homoserine dehydrogenase I [Bacteroidia bacterium]